MVMGQRAIWQLVSVGTSTTVTALLRSYRRGRKRENARMRATYKEVRRVERVRCVRESLAKHDSWNGGPAAWECSAEASLTTRGTGPWECPGVAVVYKYREAVHLIPTTRHSAPAHFLMLLPMMAAHTRAWPVQASYQHDLVELELASAGRCRSTLEHASVAQGEDMAEGSLEAWDRVTEARRIGPFDVVSRSPWDMISAWGRLEGRKYSLAPRMKVVLVDDDQARASNPVVVHECMDQDGMATHSL